MAEMVGSLVVGEVVNRTSSFLISKHKERSATTSDSLERLEMAHIKMEAALEVSTRWQVTDVSLLRWRRKLRRAADECDASLHRWKLRALEEEEVRESLARASFPRRVAYAVSSFVSSLISRGHDESRACAVQRFEKLANGAAEFLRYMEFGSAPRKCTLFDPHVRELVVGKDVTHGMLQGARHRYLGVGSMENGMENKLCCDYQDCKAPENKFLQRFHEISWESEAVRSGQSISRSNLRCTPVDGNHIESSLKCDVPHPLDTQS